MTAKARTSLAEKARPSTSAWANIWVELGLVQCPLRERGFAGSNPAAQTGTYEH